MRRGDDPRVDLDRLDAPEPFDLPLFQDPQQLHLHIQWQVANLVEENRRAIRQLEPSDLLRDRVGVGAFLPAEELALDQRRGNRRAVHAHHLPGAAPAAGVDVGREQFLAGARFTEQQHGRVSRRDAFRLSEDVLDRRALAGDAVAPWRRASIFICAVVRGRIVRLPRRAGLALHAITFFFPSLDISGGVHTSFKAIRIVARSAVTPFAEQWPCRLCSWNDLSHKCRGSGGTLETLEEKAISPDVGRAAVAAYHLSLGWTAIATTDGGISRGRGQSAALEVSCESCSRGRQTWNARSGDEERVDETADGGASRQGQQTREAVLVDEVDEDQTGERHERQHRR